MFIRSVMSTMTSAMKSSGMFSKVSVQDKGQKLVNQCELLEKVTGAVSSALKFGTVSSVILWSADKSLTISKNEAESKADSFSHSSRFSARAARDERERDFFFKVVVPFYLPS